MAWLHATPKPARVPPGTEPPPKLSRRDKMKAAGLAVQMPPNPAPHIMTWLIEIGLKGADAPLSWLEINEWQTATGARLNGFEARLIRQLSVEYVAEGRRAEEENCPAPWAAPVTEADLKASEAKLRMVLG